MDPFSISRLDTDIGTVRVDGRFNPVDGHIDIDDLAHLDSHGWADVNHWLTEQAYEHKVATILHAIRGYLIGSDA
ncbi:MULTISPECIES: hypothetical protein [unclassified Salinivibrio]|jgi:hypothetical protein|uniref:hypothetical protein n=1 Tax=unclassified Salinivibrio TaxID=2636825 RepID=UPI0009857260|nr:MULTISPECIES: hypothetical protein [unclassified Salinivibrio]OOF27351.1 hypothetical protein BZJ18_08220 [Salinivibrio sp. IB872]PCE68283.1 hypothetical protein B6G00_08260 [Salinivibrio sp. YCSC6]QCF34831.1 hypothetical protein E8E00_00770 [Salinivibrio sp. YCSC6]